MLINKSFNLWNDDSDLTTPHFYEVVSFYENLDFLTFNNEIIINPESTANIKAVFFKIKNTEYFIGVDIYREVTERVIRVGLYDNPTRENLLESIVIGNKKGVGYMTMNCRMIITDNLYLFAPYSTFMPVKSTPVIISRFNDGKFRSIDPFLDDLINCNFDKSFFSKTTINNQLILTPARIINPFNKQLNIYPSSCFYVSGLVNKTFYKFLDGEYGYYNANILYK